MVGLAAIVFGTTGLLQALVESTLRAGSYSTFEEVLTRVLTTVITTLGLVFYAGLLDLTVGAYLEGEPDPSLRQVIRRVPHTRLLIADVILVTACATLAAFFIVPGIIALTYFCLVGPVIVTEQHTIPDAFRRSGHLVRHHFWLVLCMVVVPLLLEDQLLHGIDTDVIPGRFLDAFLASAVIGATVGAVVGLLEVVIAHQLRRRDPVTAPATP